MKYNRSRSLIKKYLDGKATPEEMALLESWYNDLATDRPEFKEEPDYDEVGTEILSRLRDQHKMQAKQRSLWPRLTAVAAMLLIGIIIYNQTRPSKVITSQQYALKNDLHPGSRGAVLTLANGIKIDLEKMDKGHEVYQGKTSIAMTGDSSLVYNSGTSNTAISYNEVFTPYGKTYSVVLADGTRVWLNSGSSLKFPTGFTGNNRTVYLKGEAYFEVIHNKEKPFYVVTGEQVTEDLGTGFNINAYNDERFIETTLIEGSIKVTKGNISHRLRPGQHALTNAGNMFVVESANVDKVSAWRNGTFVFDGENIGTIMRQIARWYNVEVIYQTSTDNKDFVATISRYSNISEVLEKLQSTGAIHFKIEGRSVFVMP